MTDFLQVITDLADIPDGCIPTDAVAVVGFLEPDGGAAFRVLTAGDCPMSTLLGLLAMAQHSLMHHANPTPCEAEDD